MSLLSMCLHLIPTHTVIFWIHRLIDPLTRRRGCIFSSCNSQSNPPIYLLKMEDFVLHLYCWENGLKIRRGVLNNATAAKVKPKPPNTNH